MAQITVTSIEAFEPLIRSHTDIAEFYAQAASRLMKSVEAMYHYLRAIDAQKALHYEQAMQQVIDRFRQQSQVHNEMALQLGKVRDAHIPVEEDTKRMFVSQEE